MRKICASLMTIALFLLVASAAQALTIEGSSSGIFTNAEGPASMVINGEDTSTFSWGSGSQSWLNYLGESFSTETETVFSVGTLTYHNGAIYANTQADSVDLDITLSLTNPSGITKDFVYDLDLINTPNTSSAYASADYVTWTNSIATSYFTYDSIDYTLEFVGFGVLNSSNSYALLNEFHVYEGSTASAQLLVKVTSDFASVPEPSTMLLLGVGIVGLAGARRKMIKK